jgi:hypothetical protein
VTRGIEIVVEYFGYGIDVCVLKNCGLNFLAVEKMGTQNFGAQKRVLKSLLLQKLGSLNFCTLKNWVA